MSVAFLKICVPSCLFLAGTFQWQADSEFVAQFRLANYMSALLIACNLHSLLARRFFLLGYDAVNSDTNVILREFSYPLHHTDRPISR